MLICSRLCLAQIKTTREVIAKHDSPGLVTFHLDGIGLTGDYDTKDAVYSNLAGVLLGTFGMLLCIAGLAFRSVVVALRLAFTIMLTLSVILCRLSLCWSTSAAGAWARARRTTCKSRNGYA